MSNLSSALSQLRRLDTTANDPHWYNQLHPLVKLVVTAGYIALAVSFPKYDLLGLLGMVIYPLAGFLLSELPFRDCLRRLRVVLPLVCFVGLFNPLLDHNTLQLGSFALSAGWISMLTLLLKGVFSVLASYLLIATTSVEKLCYALRQLHVPQLIVTQLLLTYRYLALLMEEVHRITRAYTLRAPQRKGIHIRAWGSLVGQLLLHSVDRANTVYESMTLRGYQGEFLYLRSLCRFHWQDGVYLLIWGILLVLFRRFPVILILGGLFR